MQNGSAKQRVLATCVANVKPYGVRSLRLFEIDVVAVLAAAAVAVAFA